MKRVLAALAALAAAALIWVFLAGGAFKAPFADAFPAGAIGYAGAADLSALLRELESTNFWKTLSRARGLQGEDGRPADLSALSGIAGDEAAVAFYGAGSRFGASALAAAKGGGAGGAIRAAVVSGFGGAPAGSHEGAELYSFTPPWARGIGGACAVRSGTAFLAVSSRDPMPLVKAAIDLSAGKGGVAPLGADRDFVAGIGRVAGGKCPLVACGWIGAKGIEELGKARGAAARVAGADAPFVARLLPGGPGGPPVISVGGYLCRDRGVKGMVRARFSPSGLTKTQRALLPGTPGRIGAFRLAPKGTIAVDAARIVDAGDAWKTFASSSNPAAAAAAAWLRGCGIDFDSEIAPWVGGEAAIQLSAVQAGGLFPLPKAEMIVSVKDRGRAERAVMRIMERGAGNDGRAGRQPWDFLRPAITHADHRGVAVTSLSYPIPGLSPSFCFVKDRLVVGLDRSSVMEIIDTAHGARPSLLSDPLFAEMRAGMPRRLSGCAWLDGEGALRAGEGIANWVMTVKGLLRRVSDDPIPAGDSRIEEDLPIFLAAAGACRAAMAGTVRGRDTVDHYFAVRLRDIPAARTPPDTPRGLRAKGGKTRRVPAGP